MILFRIQVNPALVKILGYGRVDEFMTKSDSDFYVNPEDRDTFIAELQDKGACENLEWSI